ncbi:hypothetical protein B0H14DRAFT_2563969 [Mycena olivaceomarginata]|nr:hypothetical protein B0H14DRAFT_2563969 [Mycena olivaceomarginata]
MKLPSGRLTFKPGDVVLGKLRGHTAWPALVVDPDALPKNVARAMHNDTDYAVIFFPTGNCKQVLGFLQSIFRKWIRNGFRRPRPIPNEKVFCRDTKKPSLAG